MGRTAEVEEEADEQAQAALVSRRGGDATCYVLGCVQHPWYLFVVPVGNNLAS